MNDLLSFKLASYLESTGGPFALRGVQVAARDLPLQLDFESGHCAVLIADEAIALIEAIYAPDEWWTVLGAGGSVRLSCGRATGRVLGPGDYVLGDVHELGYATPATTSSLNEPAALVEVTLQSGAMVYQMQFAPDDETLLSGVILRSTLSDAAVAQAQAAMDDAPS